MSASLEPFLNRSSLFAKGFGCNLHEQDVRRDLQVQSPLTNVCAVILHVHFLNSMHLYQSDYRCRSPVLYSTLNETHSLWHACLCKGPPWALPWSAAATDTPTLTCMLRPATPHILHLCTFMFMKHTISHLKAFPGMWSQQRTCLHMYLRLQFDLHKCTTAHAAATRMQHTCTLTITSDLLPAGIPCRVIASKQVEVNRMSIDGADRDASQGPWGNR